MSTPEPIDDSFPESWKPRERRQADAQRAEFEKHIRALASEELERILKDR